MRRSTVRRMPGLSSGWRLWISSNTAIARNPGAAEIIGTISSSEIPANGSERRRPRGVVDQLVDQSHEVLANRTGCLLGLWPGNRLIARHRLLLVHVCLDQARIDRKPFAANQPGRDALRHHAFENPPQSSLSRTCSCLARQNTEWSGYCPRCRACRTNDRQGSPAHLRADTPLRTDRKHVANDQHPDHQYRINRRSACVRVVRCKLLVNPTQVEHRIDLPDQMISRHHLVEIKRVKELPLSTLSRLSGLLGQFEI
jgi:hypothetical protein